LLSLPNYHRLRLIDTSKCVAKADADTQLTVFDSSAPDKQLLIFI
jgi:hypothetical protein